METNRVFLLWLNGDVDVYTPKKGVLCCMYILWVGMCSWILIFDDDHMLFHMVVGSMQAVPISTKLVSSNPVQAMCTRDNIMW